MSMDPDDIDWSLTTWEGSRREQLRQWRMLSVRERLQAIEALATVARALSDAGARWGARAKRSDPNPRGDTTSERTCYDGRLTSPPDSAVRKSGVQMRKIKPREP